jgi:hypothetical protein
MTRPPAKRQKNRTVVVVDPFLNPTLGSVITEQYDGGFDDYGGGGDFYPGYGGGGGYSSSGGGATAANGYGALDRGTFLGTMLSPAVDTWNMAKYAGSRFLIHGVAFSVMAMSYVTALFPYSKLSVQRQVVGLILGWQNHALDSVDKQFEQQLGAAVQGWETLKKDIFGLGFIASPYNVIAGVSLAGASLDAALSLLDYGAWPGKFTSI